MLRVTVDVCEVGKTCKYNVKRIFSDDVPVCSRFGEPDRDIFTSRPVKLVDCARVKNAPAWFTPDVASHTRWLLVAFQLVDEGVEETSRIMETITVMMNDFNIKDNSICGTKRYVPRLWFEPRVDMHVTYERDSSGRLEARRFRILMRPSELKRMVNRLREGRTRFCDGQTF